MFATYTSPDTDTSSPKTLTPEPLRLLRAQPTMYPAETDKDVATEPALDSEIGDLRRMVVSLQKNVNVFLTERMNSAGASAGNGKGAEKEDDDGEEDDGEEE